MSSEKLSKLIAFLGQSDYEAILYRESVEWTAECTAEWTGRWDAEWDSKHPSRMLTIYRRILDHGDVELLRIVDEIFPKFQPWYCERINADKLNYINRKLADCDMWEFSDFLSYEVFDIDVPDSYLPLERCIKNGATDCIDYFMKEHKTVFFPDRQGIQFSYPLATACHYANLRKDTATIDYLINNHSDKFTQEDYNAAYGSSNSWSTYSHWRTDVRVYENICARLLPYVTTSEINC